MNLEAVAGSPVVLPHPAPFPAVVVELRGIRFAYPGQSSRALDLEHLVIRRGERVALVGQNGCGKTTLLRVLNGSLMPQHGTVAIGGTETTPAQLRKREMRRRIAFIFQGLHLVERVTVFENVVWGRLGFSHPVKSLVGFFSTDDRSRALAAIAQAGLAEMADRRVDTLSGGQKQRVAIARALAQDAEIVLADEPVSSLDPARADETLELLGRLCRLHGRTLLVSLHSPDLALRHADRVLGLGGGRLVVDEPSHKLSLLDLHALYEGPEERRSTAER